MAELDASCPVPLERQHNAQEMRRNANCWESRQAENPPARVFLLHETQPRCPALENVEETVVECAASTHRHTVRGVFRGTPQKQTA